ncbi:MAG: hypothetical protein WCK90_00415 [archaeon]
MARKIKSLKERAVETILNTDWKGSQERINWQLSARLYGPNHQAWLDRGRELYADNMRDYRRIVREQKRTWKEQAQRRPADPRSFYYGGNLPMGVDRTARY